MSESQDPSQEEGLQEMGILDHLEELRWVITRCAVFLLCLFPIAVIYSREIVTYIVKLSNVGALIATDPAEIFMQQFRIGFMVSLYLGIPYVIYQIWKFVSPGLYEKEKRWGKYAACASYVLFLLGSLFGLLVIVPICLNFFSSLETEAVRYTPRLADMISFILRISAATGLASQLPVVVILLFALGLVSIQTLVRVRPWVIVTVFVLSAILTPPDVTSQLLLGLPTCLIYELSLIVCRILSIGKDEADTSRSKFIKGAAFATLFIIVFGGSFGLWYTYNWYKNQGVKSLVSNVEDVAAYADIFKTEQGPTQLSKALTEERDEKEKRTIYKVLFENWESGRLKAEDKTRMLKYAFKPELTLIKTEELTQIDFKVSRRVNIPVNINFYWQLKANDRVFMWPDADNNYKYTYDKSKKAESVIRKDVTESIPLAKEFLKQ
ncbi:MAG: twin-arginine translocase subunit TatC, partial [Lentisphaeraceae bacterium]|nr:twin-arginine translocase subunit TatC [Lentisphaeraceae bacterium]